MSRCFTCRQNHPLDQPCPTMLRDTVEAKEQRGGIPFPGHNRKARRKMAKQFKLFKDPTGEAWRRANNHMKDRRDAKP